MVGFPERLSDILNHLHLGVAIFDSAHRLISWNRHFEQNLKFPKGDLGYGDLASDVIEKIAKRGGAERAALSNEGRSLADILSSGQDVQIVFPIAGDRSNLGDYVCEFACEHTDDRLLVMSCNVVSGQDQKQQEMLTNQWWFDYFAESSSEWLWEMDAELRFTYLSPNIKDIVGVDPEWHYGKSRRELLHNDYDREQWDAHLHCLEARRPFRDFTYYRVGEGVKPIWISTSGVPVLDSQGHFVGYRGTGADITERKAIEAHLMQSDKLATLGTLSAGMAHELSQPLNIIRLKVDSIIYDLEESKSLNRDDREDLEEINSQVMRMAEIIDHMRIFSRKETASSKPFMPAVSLAAAVRLVESQYAACGIELEVHLPPASRNILGSASQLEQVILNLLANARDAIEARAETEGSALFHGKIAIEMIEDDMDDSIVITVADNGGGIQENIINNIFDPFFTTKDVGKGTGLGLSISYSIIENLGGKMQAHNTNDGVAFQISLPITE